MRPTRTILILVSFVSIMLAACGVAPEPDLDASPLDLRQSSSLRVRFLPPLGRPYRGHDETFDGNLDLEIAVFNLNPRTLKAYGDALPPALSTADGSIGRKNGGYDALWRVKTTAHAEGARSLLRVEIRELGAPAGPVCNDSGTACVGFLDAFVLPDRHRSHRPGLRTEGADVPPSGFIVVGPHATVPLRFLVKATAGAVPTHIGGLKSVASSGSTALDEDLGNCPTGEFDTPSQGLQAIGAGLQAVGAIGGVFVGPTASFADKITWPLYLGLQVANSLTDPLPSAITSQSHTQSKVAILVVDDFGVTPAYTLPTEFMFPHRGFDATDVAALFADGSVSHGALVINELSWLIMGAGYVPPSLDPAENAVTHEPYWTFKNYAGQEILLQAVDAGGLNTDTMPHAIRSAAAFYTGTLGVQRMVLNMSFAVVPCAITGDYDLSNLPTFEAYVEALGAANSIPQSSQDDLKKLVTTPVALAADPLFDYLNCPLPATDGSSCDGSGDDVPGQLTALVHVASSGNYGLPYALYPSALPSVISVGSVDVTLDGYGATRSDFSNGAEVVAPGSLLVLGRGPGVTVAIAGTSFSAPVVTLLEALDLSRETQRCDPGSVAGRAATAPALAYGEFDNDPILDATGRRGPALPDHCTP